MWTLIYKLNDVILKEVSSIDEILKEENIIEAHLFDKSQDVLIDNNYNQIHLEDTIKDNDEQLHFDEEMFISKLYSKLYKSKYSNKNKIVVRNYLDFNEDGILYVRGSRLVEVK